MDKPSDTNDGATGRSLTSKTGATKFSRRIKSTYDDADEVQLC